MALIPHWSSSVAASPGWQAAEVVFLELGAFAGATCCSFPCSLQVPCLGLSCEGSSCEGLSSAVEECLPCQDQGISAAQSFDAHLKREEIDLDFRFFQTTVIKL